jgi:hypothetical protein
MNCPKEKWTMQSRWLPPTKALNIILDEWQGVEGSIQITRKKIHQAKQVTLLNVHFSYSQKGWNV